MLKPVDSRAERRARRAVVAELANERDARGRNSKKLTRWRRFRRRVGGVLVDSMAPLLLRLLTWTWRIERTGDAGLELQASERPWILTLWHGRMLATMCMKGHCRRNIAVLVSPSDDGGLAKRALTKMRYQIVRGSLSRRGARAMREMVAVVQGGGQLVITPDGPRGPRHSMNSGPAWLARTTGVPIVAVTIACSRAWRLRSWDRMTIPKPFARVVVHYGQPVQVAADTDDGELEGIAQTLREQMIADELAAFARLQVAPDHDG